MAVGLPMKTTYANGDVYSASDVNDITGTVNLIGQTNNFYAGKNKIINGDFSINQRNFTSNTTSGTFNFDRWKQLSFNGSETVTPQTFTPGTAPVSGYEGKTYVQCVTASQGATTYATLFYNGIEDVRSFAGQTATISFWGKVASGTATVAIDFEQYFGVGGSASVFTNAGTATLNTTWTRYSMTVSIPSISGKTIGTGSHALYPTVWLSSGASAGGRYTSIGSQNATFQFWGFQMENGSTATAFQTATGTIQGELAACQRYYYRQSIASGYATLSSAGIASSTTSAKNAIKTPVTMRVAPTSIDYSSSIVLWDGVSVITISAMALEFSSQDTIEFTATASTALTQYRPYFLLSNNVASQYLGFSAEL